MDITQAGRALVLAAAFMVTGCGAQVLRNVPQSPVVHDDAIWIVETNVKTDGSHMRGSYNTAVIVCVRDANPACVRVLPEDLDRDSYRAWIQSIPRRPVVHVVAPSPPLAPEWHGEPEVP